MSVPRTAIAVALVLAFSPLPAAHATSESKHRAAAENLMIMIHLEDQMHSMTEVMLKAQLQGNPKLADFEDIMRGFFAKYISYAALKEDLVNLYVEHFTEAELRDMAAFYSTPTGQRCIQLMPSLLQKGADLGRERVTEHMDELKDAVMARIQEKSKSEAAPAAQETAPPDADKATPTDPKASEPPKDDPGKP